MEYLPGDETIIPNDEINWSLFDPEMLEHVQTKVLAFALERHEVTASLLATCLISWGNPQIVKPKQGQRMVDISAVVPARTRAEVAEEAAKAAVAEYRQTIRNLYAEGATAASLAKESGLSLPRIHQIVAGARQG